MQIDPQLVHEGYVPHATPDKTAPRDGGGDELGYNPQLNCGYDAQLDHDRRENKNKLRRRFEHIFEKYEQDFEGIGDEIDIVSGEIVVDNGHVKHMSHEGDSGIKFPCIPISGRAPSSRLGDVGDILTASRSDEDSENGDGVSEDGDNEDLDSTSADTVNGISSVEEQTAESATSHFEEDESAQESDTNFALDPALLKASHDLNTVRHLQQTGGLPNAATDRPGETSNDDPYRTTPDNILSQMPHLEASMLNFQSKYQRGQNVDPDTIQALGLSIANQLADLMSHGNQNGSRRKSTEPADPTWSYPDLPRDLDKPRKRARSPSPAVQLEQSPNEKSLWAPLRVQPRRKKRKVAAKKPAQELVAAQAVEGQTAEPNLPEANPDKLQRICYNCHIEESHVWRNGPDGTLCNQCGMYYYRYGLMRPIGLLSDSEDSDGERDPLEVDPFRPRYSANTSRQLKPSGLKNSRFSLEEDVLIIKFKEVDLLSWEEIADHFPERSAYAIQCRYSKKLHFLPTTARDCLINQGYEFKQHANGAFEFIWRTDNFKPEEDALILRLRNENSLGWDSIAVALHGRTAPIVELRYNELTSKGSADDSRMSMDKPNTIRRKPRGQGTRLNLRYSVEEDTLLVKLREVDQLDWSTLAKNFPGRRGMSLQKRYVRVLCGQHPDSICPRPPKEKRCWEYDTGSTDGEMNDERITSFTEEEHTPTTDEFFTQDLFPDGEQNDSEPDLPARLPHGHPRPAGINPSDQIQAEAEASQILESFSKDEDDLIVKLFELEKLSWQNIAALMPGRSASSVSGRYYHHLRRERGRAKHPSRNMSTASPVPPRSQVWNRALPKRNPRAKLWTPEEEEMILQLREDNVPFGKIAERMQGRTTMAVESHYYLMSRNKGKAKLLSKKAQSSLLRQAVDNNARRHSEAELSLADLLLNAQGGAVQNELDERMVQDDFETESELDEDSQLSERPSSSHSHSFVEKHDVGGRLVAISSKQNRGDTKTIADSMPPTDRPESIFRNYIDLEEAPPASQAGDDRTRLPKTPAREADSIMPSSEPSPGPIVNYMTPARLNEESHPYYAVPSYPTLSSPIVYHAPEFETDAVPNVPAEDLKTKAKAKPKKGRPKVVSPPISLSDVARELKEQRSAALADEPASNHDRIIYDSEDHGPVNEEASEHEMAEDGVKHADYSVNAEVVGDAAAQDNALENTAHLEAPALSWTDLATMALRDNDKKPMNTSEIYKYIVGKFPYYKSNPDGRFVHWREYVRLALKNQPAFEKVNDSRRGLWVLSEDREDRPKRRGRPKKHSPKSDLNQNEPRTQVGRPYTKSPSPAKEPAQPRRAPGRPRKQTQAPARSSKRDSSRASRSRSNDVIYASDAHDDLDPPASLEDSFSEALIEPASDSVDEALLSSHAVASDPAELPKANAEPLPGAPGVEISSDINREPESTPGRFNMSLRSQAPSSSDTVPSSSSPILTKKPVPENVYKRTATPGTGRSTLSSKSQHLPSSANRATPAPRARLSTVSTSSAAGGSKRIVYTPMREFDDSEDELAV